MTKTMHEDDEDMDMDALDGDEDDAAVRWKSNMAERAKLLHGKRRPYRAVDLARLIYDESVPPRDALKRWRAKRKMSKKKTWKMRKTKSSSGKQSRLAAMRRRDRSLPRFDYEQLAAKWSNEESIEELRARFSTANLLDDEGGEDDEFSGIDDGDEDEDDEGDGAFEDLETGEKHGVSEESKPRNNRREHGGGAREERQAQGGAQSPF